MLAIKRTTYNNVRDRLVTASVALSEILRLDATGLTISEAGAISSMTINQLQSIERKTRAIEIALSNEDVVYATEK